MSTDYLEAMDPSDEKDYGISFAAELLATGDTSVASATWTVSPTGPTLYTSSISAGVCKTWIKGGTAGTVYTLTCTAVTAPGARKHQRSVLIACVER